MPPAPNSPIRNSLRRTVVLGGSSGRLSRRDQLTEAARQQHMRASLSHDQSPTRIRFFGPYERTSRRDQLTEAIRQQSGPAHLPQATPSEHLVDDRAEPNAGKDEDLVPHQDERGELVPVEDENGEVEWVRQALTPSAQGRVGVIRDVEMEDFEGDVDGLGRQHMPEGQEGRQQDSATTGYGAVVGANPENLLDRPEKVPPAIRRFQGPRPPSSSASSPQAQMPPPSSDPSYSHTQQRKLDHWDAQRQQQQRPVQQATLPGPGTREADARAERGIAGQSSEFSIRGVADRGRGQGVGNGLRARGRGRGRGSGS
ncbi:MAG: hypothetical protein Q9202_006144 [Teloschistes flavicans]